MPGVAPRIHTRCLRSMGETYSNISVRCAVLDRVEIVVFEQTCNLVDDPVFGAVRAHIEGDTIR